MFYQRAKKSVTSDVLKPEWFNGKVITTVLIAKFLVLIFGIQSYQIIENKPVKELYWLQGLWKRWDVDHYLFIAQNGYTATGDNRFSIVFFPLYPSLIAFLNLIVNDYLLSAFLVSGAASVALGLLLRLLVKLDYDEETAQSAVLFLFIFPTSYFLHIPYTESLFLALGVGCFLAARTKRWALVGLLGFLCCLTRINGLILCLALPFEILLEYRETKKFNPNWVWLAVAPLGFVLYLGINYYVTGDALMFLTYQREHWFKQLSFPIKGIYGAYRAMLDRSPVESQTVGFQELLFVTIGLSTTILSWFHLRKSYFVWALFNWLLFVSTSFILSVPRYTLVLFPLFILMASAGRKSDWLKTVLLLWSVLYLALFTAQFVRGQWAF